MALHNKIGAWGEKITMEYFLRKGYAIVARNDVEGNRRNEIDLIVSKENRIVFVEVKTRTRKDEDPIHSITRQKRTNMLKAGITYLKAHPYPPLEPQFDLFFINGDENDYSIEHLEDVFLPPLIRYGSDGAHIDC